MLAPFRQRSGFRLRLQQFELLENRHMLAEIGHLQGSNLTKPDFASHPVGSEEMQNAVLSDR